MRIHRHHGPSPVRRGTQAVEFALSSSILFLILWGMVEIGRGFMVQGILTNAASAGCRAGVVPGAGTTDVTAAVSSYMTGVGVSGYSTQIQVSGASGDPSTA